MLIKLLNLKKDDGQNNSYSGEVIIYIPLNKGEFGQSVDESRSMTRPIHIFMYGVVALAARVI